MPDQIQLIPIDAIDAAALTRDRVALDEAALDELIHSIRDHGLRLPIEVYPLPNAGPDAAVRFGLISGWRRLTAFRRERAFLGLDHYQAIPAIVREPDDLAAALVAMVEENEIRVGLSPWERGRIAVRARDDGAFESIDSAVDSLFAATSRQKRAKLRAVAHLVTELEGPLAAPEALTERSLLRLASALQKGYGALIAAALQRVRRTPEIQWETLAPILAEAEAPEPDYAPHERRAGRPRRVSRPRPGLTITREKSPDGYVLRFAGRDARSALLDEVIEEIERMFSPA